MPERSGNQTSSTSNPSEGELQQMHMPELRQRAEEAGIENPLDMNKEELVRALSEAGQSGSASGGEEQGEGQGSRSNQQHQVTHSEGTKYSQEITSPEDEPERPGRSLITTDHEVIRRWAEARDAQPATVPGTRHGDHLGVLRFDFPGYGGEDLEHVSWDECFATFEERDLNFIYQEETSDGKQSNFFRLESPHREDA